MKEKFGRGDHEGIMNFARIITLVAKNIAVKCFVFFLSYMQDFSGSHLGWEAGSTEWGVLRLSSVQPGKFQGYELIFDPTFSVHVQSNAVFNKSQFIQRIDFVRSGLLWYLLVPNRVGGTEDWRKAHKEWLQSVHW